jgi:integrase
MTRAIERLSSGAVQKARGRDKPYYLADGGGLYLRIAPSGAASWVFRYTTAGRMTDMGLGPLHTIGLKEARERARAQRLIRLDGGDPIAVRRAGKPVASKSFRECADLYMAAMAPGRADKTKAQVAASFATYVYPIIGDMPIGAVDKRAVLDVLEPIWSSKLETAQRVRNRVENVIAWATQHGHRPEGANPAAWKGALQFAGLPTRQKTVEHLAAMPYGDVPAFMKVVRARVFRTSGIPAKALEFLILATARQGEVVGATWQEIDTEARLWVIPAERMKMRQEHRVPLSDAALALLAALPRNGPRIFPGCSGNAMKYVMETSGVTGLTVHGFRSSFRDWCAETGIRQELAEAALAHNDKSATEAAYNRTALVEQRRPVMVAWARFIAGQDDAKVIPLRSA